MLILSYHLGWGHANIDHRNADNGLEIRYEPMARSERRAVNYSMIGKNSPTISRASERRYLSQPRRPRPAPCERSGAPVRRQTFP